MGLKLEIGEDFVEVLVFKKITDKLFEALSNLEVGFVGRILLALLYLLDLYFFFPRIPGIKAKAFFLTNGLVSWIFSGWLLLLLIRFFVFRWTGGYRFLLLFGVVRFEMLSIIAIKIVEFVQRNDVASVQKNVVNFLLQNWIFFDQFLHNFDDKEHRGIL